MTPQFLDLNSCLYVVVRYAMLGLKIESLSTGKTWLWFGLRGFPDRFTCVYYMYVYEGFFSSVDCSVLFIYRVRFLNNFTVTEYLETQECNTSL